MKFLAIILLLICSSAFAQKNGDLIKKYIRDGKDSIEDFQYHYKFSEKDSLDFDISRDDIFKTGGFGPCHCPTPEQVQQMPRELHLYKWVNKDKPIVINDSTYQHWIKSDLAFKKMYHRADSLMRINNQQGKQKTNLLQ